VTAKRAIIYVRVSTEDQAENGTSLETQELTCCRRASELGYVVAATFRDEGVSGALYEARDGIQRALSELESGNADALIVHSISRLSRDLEHQQAISKRVARTGGTLIVCDLPTSDTEEGDLMFGITGAFAQYERKLIRRRTMAGSRSVAEKGRQPVRAMDPFGYHIVRKADVLAGHHPAGSEGTYVINESQAAVVLDMFQGYAAAGMSLYALAKRLEARGISTPRSAAHWSMQTIAGILKNPVYKGSATWGRHGSLVDEARQATGKKPRYKVLRSEPTVHIPVPAIVDAVTWQACQDRMATNKMTQGGNPQRTFLLSAIARCPQCGRGLTGKREYRTGRRYYLCNRDAISRHVPTASFDAATLEDYTCNAVLAAASAPEIVRGAYAAAASLSEGPSSVDVTAVTAALKAVAAREKAAATAQVDALAAGRSSVVYDEILAEAAEERRRLEAQIQDATLVPRPQASAIRASDATHAADAIEALQRVLSSTALTNAERRSALAGFVQAIVPDQTDGIKVVLRAPLSVLQKNKNTNQFFIGLPCSSLARLR
jgi:site-specific DNA recombinase